MSTLYSEQRLRILFAVTMMGVIGVTVISPVLPSIVDKFAIHDDQVGLVVTAFTLPGVFVALLIGIFADRWGRKPVLIPLLFLFGIAGAACAFAPNFRVLLVLRVLQGIGGAGLVSLATTLIGDYYDGLERGSAMGLNASVLSIATALYPLLGGLLGSIGWFVPFLLFIVAVPIGLWALFYLPEPTTWESIEIREYLKSLMDIAKSRKTIAGAFASLVAFVLHYGGIITYFPIFMERQFGSSAVLIGGLQSSMALVVAGITSQNGVFLERFSERSLFTLGFVGYGLGLFLIPFMPGQIWFLLPLSIFGVGHGLVIPNVQTFMTKLAPGQLRGATMSLYNIALRIGQTLGPVIFAAVYSYGLSILYWVAGGIGIGGFLVLILLSHDI